MLTKEVAFWKYCWKCEYKDVQCYEEPCNSCMTVPAREFSSKPINYKERTGEKSDRKRVKVSKGVRRTKSRNSKQG